ncbi:putative esterase of the alpha-beta hydrolase superfamily [Spirochaeta africana DSM 8902]|uniref:Putative esterase of the alpha-beta hydrolase superfamily n=2 Tax=Spirochaeta TaxID=146 RepID=H9UKZ3_SPIAZ|nr:putative esterase of the alpha-beta hydrolase superfamily [Spirochaeta africana DSM 8902]
MKRKSAILVAAFLFFVGCNGDFSSSGNSNNNGEASAESLGNDTIDGGTALVLGGGGAWGAAHIGVIEVLLENEIHFDFITGTSAGAIAGAFLSDGYSPSELREEFTQIKLLDLARPSLQGIGFFRIDPVVEYLSERLNTDRLEHLQIPVVVTATDIETGELVYYDQGPTGLLLAASMALPVIFDPAEYDGRFLADGGIINNLPIDAAKAAGADRIIAVNVAGSFSDTGLPEGRVEYANRVYNIMRQAMYSTDGADVYIEPDLSGIAGIDFEAYDEMIKLGREAALAVLEELKEL